MMLLPSHNFYWKYYLTIASSQTTITPLFEKMLTASDVARIGRLVLPKKCAEVTPSVLNI